MKRKIDVRKLVERFGGPTNLQHRLSHAGHEISVKAINMWINRGSLPSGWIPELYQLAEEDKAPLKLDDYMLEASADEDTSFLE